MLMLLTAGVFGLMQALGQDQTNGASLWGTSDGLTFSRYLTSNPLPDGFPWGAKIAIHFNLYKEAPNTGATRHYQFTLFRAQKAPDGYLKSTILINGQFPGPVIEANWGDWIEVQVPNSISNPTEGTSLHRHGLLQTATPWYDGIPSVQQCPVAPGASFTYRVKADLYGTSWYHFHYSAQYAGRLLGPMVIHGPANYHCDIDLGPVFISDLEGTDQSKWRQYSNNNLINGKMNFDCSGSDDGTSCTKNAPLAKSKFHKGKAHRIRLINAGAAGQQIFSIDEHEMTVIANDYVPIKPYKTTIVFVGALAEVYYEGADTTQTPTTQPRPYTDYGKRNNDDLSLTVPYYAITPDPEPAKTFQVAVDEQTNSTDHLEWRLNQQAFRGNYNKPILLLAQEKNQSYELDSPRM